MSREAVAADGTLREPVASGEEGRCFECGDTMLGRVGTIMVPHWAHTGDTTCEFRAESSESYWHKAWKTRLARRGWTLEKTIRDATGSRHRADVTHTSGTVVELQYAYQDPREIKAREAAYPQMLWMLNGAVLLKVARWGASHDGRRGCPEEWGTGQLEIDAGAARSMQYMRRPVILDFATPIAMREEDRAGLYYVGNWSVGGQGGAVQAQCIYRGWTGEDAAAALHGWFAYLRWAAA